MPNNCCCLNRLVGSINSSLAYRYGNRVKHENHFLSNLCQFIVKLSSFLIYTVKSLWKKPSMTGWVAKWAEIRRQCMQSFRRQPREQQLQRMSSFVKHIKTEKLSLLVQSNSSRLP